MGTVSGIRLVPVGVLVQRKGIEAAMGMFRRREDSEAAGLRAEAVSLQGRCPPMWPPSMRGTPCPIRRGLEGITLSASCPVTTAVTHPHTATARPAGNSHCRVPPVSPSAAAVTWTLPTPSTADQHPESHPLCAAPRRSRGRPTRPPARLAHEP